MADKTSLGYGHVHVPRGDAKGPMCAARPIATTSMTLEGKWGRMSLRHIADGTGETAP